MAKYRFRLSTLVKLREAVRDQRRASLAEAQHALDLVEERQAKLRNEMREHQREYQDASRPGKVSVDKLIEAQRYELILKAEQERLQQQHATLDAEVQRRREALVVADREVKVLEKLREKQAQRQQLQDEVNAQKQIDEMAGRLHPTEEVM